MKLITTLFTATLALSTVAAQAGQITSNEALVLTAALADIVFPAAAPVLARALDNQCEGPNNFSGTANISVKKIDCHLSHVAVGSMECIVDGNKIKGRQAYELFSVISGVDGVVDSGGGSTYASTAETSCSVDFAEIASCAGSGAVCTVTPARN